uniref:Uncharacterized protein n=1 Tax=Meloidogyne hapla TaxID=6305 RepID=A0A1I8BRY5_MELHA
MPNVPNKLFLDCSPVGDALQRCHSWTPFVVLEMTMKTINEEDGFNKMWKNSRRLFGFNFLWND